MAKVQSLENVIFVSEDIMQILENRVTELKIERKEIVNAHKEQKFRVKMLRNEINLINEEVKNYKVAIKDQILNRLGSRMGWKFINDMEMAIIDYMIILSKPIARKTENDLINETTILKVILLYTIIFHFC